MVSDAGGRGCRRRHFVSSSFTCFVTSLGSVLIEVCSFTVSPFTLPNLSSATSRFRRSDHHRRFLLHRCSSIVCLVWKFHLLLSLPLLKSPQTAIEFCWEAPSSIHHRWERLVRYDVASPNMTGSPNATSRKSTKRSVSSLVRLQEEMFDVASSHYVSSLCCLSLCLISAKFLSMRKNYVQVHLDVSSYLSDGYSLLDRFVFHFGTLVCWVSKSSKWLLHCLKHDCKFDFDMVSKLNTVIVRSLTAICSLWLYVGVLSCSYSPVCSICTLTRFGSPPTILCDFVCMSLELFRPSRLRRNVCTCRWVCKSLNRIYLVYLPNLSIGFHLSCFVRDLRNLQWCSSITNVIFMKGILLISHMVVLASLSGHFFYSPRLPCIEVSTSFVLICFNAKGLVPFISYGLYFIVDARWFMHLNRVLASPFLKFQRTYWNLWKAILLRLFESISLSPRTTIRLFVPLVLVRRFRHDNSCSVSFDSIYLAFIPAINYQLADVLVELVLLFVNLCSFNGVYTL